MSTLRQVTRTGIERSAARQARENRTRLGAELRAAREDAGLSLSRIALASGLSKSHVHDIEAARVEARWESLSRLAAALGASLSVRLYPGTGPIVRDHVQSTMIRARLTILDGRWRPRVEVAVYRPVRGVIDLVLDDAADGVAVACEAQSELRRLEQQIRWSKAKADALIPDIDRDARAARRVGRLLLLRSTPHTRAVVAEYAELVAAAYPASATDTFQALASDATWPGDAILACRVAEGQATILERPPRGIRVGR